MTKCHGVIVSTVAAAGLAGAAGAQSTVFSTNGPDFRMAAASRSETKTLVETETADDFVLAGDTRLTGASVIGFIPHSAPLTDIQSVMVRIYRVFPFDSNAVRVPRVPTRVNSPGDGTIEVRDSPNAELTFTALALTPSLTALNSVVDGLHLSPNQTTGGEGPVTADEIEVSIHFTLPIDLPPGHYFFVPEVTLRAGTFLWLSAPKPIVSPGTPFAGDLQAWMRNSFTFPDWLRVGQDIVGGNPAPAFNMVFLLEGEPRCYANCDGSTATPILNINDFTCFLNQFARGVAAANCDNSTTSPVLNVLDFVCFLNRFAAGCS